jgi:hypothetical protein
MKKSGPLDSGPHGYCLPSNEVVFVNAPLSGVMLASICLSHAQPCSASITLWHRQPCLAALNP